MTTFTGPPIESERGTGALTFGTFLDEIAQRYGDREAVVLNVAGRDRVSRTYAELRDEARRVAKALVAAGVSRGTRVGVLTSGRPEWISAVFGAAMAGGVAVPFNTFAEPRELDHLLRHSDVAHRDHADRVPAPSVRRRDRAVVRPARRTPGRDSSARRSTRSSGASSRSTPPTRRAWCSRGTTFLAEGDVVPDDIIDAIVRETTPSDDGIIIYSSGTTSLPKGVLHMHRAPMLQSWRHGYREGFIPDDRVYSELPLFWTAGLRGGGRSDPLARCLPRAASAVRRRRRAAAHRGGAGDDHADAAPPRRRRAEVLRARWARHLDDPARPVPHHARATTREANRESSGVREQRDVHERDRAPERCVSRGPRHSRRAHRRLEHPDHRRRCRAKRSGRAKRARSRSRASP